MQDHLVHLETERQERLEKEVEKEQSAESKTPAWINLHMQQAEKRTSTHFAFLVSISQANSKQSLDVF